MCSGLPTIATFPDLWQAEKAECLEDIYATLTKTEKFYKVLKMNARIYENDEQKMSLIQALLVRATNLR